MRAWWLQCSSSNSQSIYHSLLSIWHHPISKSPPDALPLSLLSFFVPVNHTITTWGSIVIRLARVIAAQMKEKAKTDLSTIWLWPMRTVYGGWWWWTTAWVDFDWWTSSYSPPPPAPTVNRVRVVVNGRNEPIVKAYKIYIKTCRQATIVFDWLPIRPLQSVLPTIKINYSMMPIKVIALWSKRPIDTKRRLKLSLWFLCCIIHKDDHDDDDADGQGQETWPS